MWFFFYLFLQCAYSGGLLFCTYPSGWTTYMYWSNTCLKIAHANLCFLIFAQNTYGFHEEIFLSVSLRTITTISTVPEHVRVSRMKKKKKANKSTIWNTKMFCRLQKHCAPLWMLSSRKQYYTPRARLPQPKQGFVEDF